LVCTPSAQAQDLKALEKELESSLKGRVLTLKVFDRSNWLRFNAQGELVDGGTSGPWTLYSKFEVADVRLRDQKLEIEGNRTFVRFDEKKEMLHLRTRERVTVEVTYGSSDELADQVRASLPKIFLGSGESLAPFVPEYWRSFLVRETVERRKSVPDGPEEEAWRQRERIRVSSSVQKGKIINQVLPRYPEVAARGRVGGTVVLEVIVAADGSVKNFRIVEPARVGLDEAAVEAVQQWKYRPTMLNDKPVEVQTIINVVFKIP